MSYDIYLKDPVTNEVAEVPGHLMIGGTYKADYHPETGTFTPALNTEAHLNITYNYAPYYREVYPENGIRTIYGRSGVDSITILENLIEKIKAKYYVDERWITTKRMERIYFDKDRNRIDLFDAIHEDIEYEAEDIEVDIFEGDVDDYWKATAANAIRPLYQLIALAKMRPDGIWDGD